MNAHGQKRIEAEVVRRQMIDGLLVRPRPRVGEGPGAYFMRVAEANWISPALVREAGIVFDPVSLQEARLLGAPAEDANLHDYVHRVSTSRELHRRIWNGRRRVCPSCLAESGQCDVGWELIFHDACPQHGVWLVDHCSQCDTPLSFERGTPLRCACDADLREEKVSKAPDAVVRLAGLIRMCWNRGADESMPAHLAQLEPVDMYRLVLMLGAGLDPEQRRLPHKPADVGSLERSWTITSRAAEILCNWPDGFHRSLSSLAAHGFTHAETGKLSQALGATYRYFLAEMRAPAFAPIYEAFCDWVESSWTGSLAKRNKGLLERVIENRQWIPAKAACSLLGVGVARLRLYVEIGELEAEEIISRAGRRFMVVNRLQVEQLRERINASQNVDLRTVTELLGLSKRRMRNLLLPVFHNARKLHSTARHWEVPLSDVEELLACGRGLPHISVPDEPDVSLNHLLRYWGWLPETVAKLVIAVRAGDILPTAVCTEFRGVAGWVFPKVALVRWQAMQEEGVDTWLTSHKAAAALGVTRGCFFHLINAGFIQYGKRPGKGMAFYIHRDELARFRQKYAILKQLADQLGKLPVAVVNVLRDEGILPILDQRTAKTGPTVFQRDEHFDSIVTSLLGEGAARFLSEGYSTQAIRPALQPAC